VAQPKPRSGPSIGLMIISIVLVLLGFYTLNMALATLPNDFTLGTVYFVVAVLSFGFVALSIVRVRRGYQLANPAANKVLSIVKCRNCSFKQLKAFALGDYVAKTLGMCTQCNAANLFIDGIYGEGPQRR
jgi:hypothetical protein